MSTKGQSHNGKIAATTLLILTILIMMCSPGINWFNLAIVWALIFFAIYFVNIDNIDDIEAKWKRKWKIAAGTLLILTILILPFHSWGIYNIDGLLNQGMDVGSSDTFDLVPEETYTSLALSNMYSESSGILFLSAVGGTCTFYICDVCFRLSPTFTLEH